MLDQILDRIYILILGILAIIGSFKSRRDYQLSKPEDHITNVKYELQSSIGDFEIVARMTTDTGNKIINLKHNTTGKIITINESYLDMLFKQKQ